MTMEGRDVLYTMKDHRILDLAVLDNENRIIGLYSGKTYAELLKEYGAVSIGQYNDVHKAREDSFITGPRRITRDRFMALLEVLPPLNWRQMMGAESFMLSEFKYGDITQIVVRIGKDYFTFHDRASLTHADIMAKVESWLGTTANAYDAGRKARQDGLPRAPMLNPAFMATLPAGQVGDNVTRLNDYTHGWDDENLQGEQQ